MLHKLFEEKAAETPHHPALHFHDETLNYEQLNARANQLAYVLLSENIKQQDHIIVKLERSIDQVIIFLALLKIGAIYVPLSTEQPDSRLQQMVKDCAPKLIITNTDNQTLTHGPASAMPRTFDIHNKTAQLSNAPKDNPQVLFSNSNPVAYVAYSSGSTGRPKGIPIHHAGMIEYWKEILEKTIAHKAPRVLANVSIDFDAHIWEYLMAWTFGSTLYLTDNQTRNDSEKLAEFIFQHHITDMTLTPAVLRTFTDEQVKKFANNDGSHNEGLKAVYSTGEACTLDIVTKFTHWGIEMVNCYGPTEATFGVSIALCKPENFHNGIAPIGCPPSNSKVKVSIADDKTGSEVKEGETGELVIISPYLTSGYLNADSKSFTTQGYRTGDKFSMHNGMLYCHGRLHNLSHIKIRGQYVDVGGTENVLREHIAIEDACVVVRTGITSEPILVAFIVYKDQSLVSVNDLRKHCSSKLSTASVPTFFTPIKAMPRMKGSEKVDRDLLTKQAFDLHRDASNFYSPPANILEQQLLTLWEEILYAPNTTVKIGVTDVFNEIGGNSINATYLARKVSEKYQITVSVSMLNSLEKLTVQNLASVVREELAKKDDLEGVELAKRDNTRFGPLFMLPPISGESKVTYAKLVDALDGDIPQDIYNVKGLSPSKFSKGSCSIPELAASCLRSMRAAQPTKPLYIMGWSSGGLLAYEIALQAEKAGEPVAFVGIIDEPVPSFTSMQNTKTFASALVKLMNYFGEKHHFSLDIDADELARMSKEEQINTIFTQVPSLSGISKEIMDYVKNFLLASLTYQPAPLEKTPLTIFITLETLKEHIENDTQSQLAWNTCTYAPVSIEYVDGNHFSIMEEPKQLAGKISKHVLKLAAEKKAASPTRNTLQAPSEDMPKFQMPPQAEVKSNDSTTDEDTSKHSRKGKQKNSFGAQERAKHERARQEQMLQLQQIQAKIMTELFQQQEFKTAISANITCWHSLVNQGAAMQVCYTIMPTTQQYMQQLIASQAREQQLRQEYQRLSPLAYQSFTLKEQQLRYRCDFSSSSFAFFNQGYQAIPQANMQFSKSSHTPSIRVTHQG